MLGKQGSITGIVERVTDAIPKCYSTGIPYYIQAQRVIIINFMNYLRREAARLHAA